MRVSAEVDERALREIYLAGFERVVTQAAPWTVMCSYNRINGVYASENEWLLTEVLRREWGYDGVVVSDWGAVHDRVLGLAAGLDLEMPGSGGGTDAEIVAAVRSGALDPEVLDRAVARLLRLVDRAIARRRPRARPAGPATETGRGRPAPEGADDAAPPITDAQARDDRLRAHHTLARRVAAACAVLLKNEGGILPLDPAAAGTLGGHRRAGPYPPLPGRRQLPGRPDPARVGAGADLGPGRCEPHGRVRGRLRGRRRHAGAAGADASAGADAPAGTDAPAAPAAEAGRARRLRAEAVEVAPAADTVVRVPRPAGQHANPRASTETHMDLPAPPDRPARSRGRGQRPRRRGPLQRLGAVSVGALEDHARAVLEGWLARPGRRGRRWPTCSSASPAPPAGWPRRSRGGPRTHRRSSPSPVKAGCVRYGEGALRRLPLLRRQADGGELPVRARSHLHQLRLRRAQRDRHPPGTSGWWSRSR